MLSRLFRRAPFQCSGARFHQVCYRFLIIRVSNDVSSRAIIAFLFAIAPFELNDRELRAIQFQNLIGLALYIAQMQLLSWCALAVSTPLQVTYIYFLFVL